MPIEDADRVHSKRGKDSASITIFGRSIGVMKLMTIAGVGIGGLFLLIAAVLMMYPAPQVNIIPVQETPIIPNTPKISFDLMSTNYNYRIIKLSYVGDKPVIDFKSELLLSMYPPKSTHYVQRQAILNDVEISTFDNHTNVIYLYTGIDNNFHTSYTIPKYESCVDFLDGDWNLNIDDNTTKRNIYKFKFNITSSKTKFIENGTSINDTIFISPEYSTFFIASETYKEKISIFKPSRVIGIGNPVIDAGGFGSGITIHSNNNVISGLTIINSGVKESVDGGIVVMPGSNGNIITKNTIYKTIYGIWLNGADSNTITNNTVHDNDNTGIRLTKSSSNTITGNIAYNNIDGIHVDSASRSNIIRDNNLYNNKAYGVIIENYKLLNNICEYNIYNNNKMSCSESIDRDRTPVPQSTSVTSTVTEDPDDWWSSCNGNPKCYQST